MSTQLPVYQQTPILSETKDASAEVPVGVLAYFRGRLSNRVHELVLSEFAAQEREGKTSRAELARRIRRKPEQITRWLGSPGNWTLDTVSDLLLGMGLEPKLSVQSLPSARVPPITMRHAPWGTTYVVDIQTPQEVARDIADGIHKSLYFSLQIQTSGSGAPMIELQPQPTLPHPTAINIPLSIKENVHDNT